MPPSDLAADMRAYLSQINAALVPLQNLFEVLDMLVKVVNTIRDEDRSA
jgi:pantothenate kinase-related protein Tda10